MPEWQVNALLDLQQYYVSGGGSKVTEVLPRLLGRPAIILNDFLEQHRDEFRSQGAKA